jgi:hypothetical protein
MSDIDSYNRRIVADFRANGGRSSSRKDFADCHNRWAPEQG